MYVENRIVYQICERCGADFTFTERYLYRPEFDTEHCNDCKLQPAFKIKRNGVECKIWHGDYDWDDNPLKPDGTLYRPGPRLCGHKDCVNSSHIDAPVERDFSRHPKIQPVTKS